MKNLIIPEYGKAEIPNTCYDKNDLAILTVLSPHQKSILFHEGANYLVIQNRAFVGVIQLSQYRLQLGAKVDCDLLYMLHFLHRQNVFYYDPSRLIELEEGDVFFDILGRLFLTKLEHLMQRGLARRFVRQEGELSRITGSIDFSKQWENQVRHRPKISCSWDSLTYDIRENQILLLATKSLLSSIQQDENLRHTLKQKFQELVDRSIRMVEWGPQVVDHRLNESYQDIMPIALLLIERCFIRSEKSGLSKGFNFLVNMNRLFEDFVLSLVIKVVGKFYPCYQVLSQVTVSDLVREGVIDVCPDILLKNKISGEIDFILDAKYMLTPNNSTYYQMIAYSLAISTVKRVLMIFPESENDVPSYVTIKDSYRDNREVKIYCQTIPLSFGLGVRVSPFVKNLENRMKRVIDEMISPVVKN